MRTPVGNAAWEPGASLGVMETGGGSGCVFHAFIHHQPEGSRTSCVSPFPGLQFSFLWGEGPSMRISEALYKFLWKTLKYVFCMLWLSGLSPTNIDQNVCNRNLQSLLLWSLGSPRSRSKSVVRLVLHQAWLPNLRERRIWFYCQSTLAASDQFARHWH